MKKLLSVVLVILLLPCISYASDASLDDVVVYHQDNFESYDVGKTALLGYSGSAKGNVWGVTSDGSNKRFKMSVNTTADMHLDKVLDSAVDGKLVFEMDILLEDYNDVSKFIQVMDSDGKTFTLAWFLKDGTLVKYDKNFICNYETNHNYKLSFAIDTDSKKFNVYLDGQHKGEFTHTLDNIFKWRIHLREVPEDFTGQSTIYIDNIRMYSGNVLLNDEDWVVVAKKYSTDVKDIMENAVAMYVGKSNVLVKGEKTYINEDKTIVPFKENGTIMLPAAFFAETTGASSSVNGNSLLIETGDRKIVFNGGSTLYAENGTNKLLKTKTEMRNGVLFASATDLCNVFSKHLHVEENGIVIYSSQDMSDIFDWNDNQKIMRKISESYMFDDVTGEQLLEMLKQRHPNNSHPRLILTDDKISEIKAEINSETGDEFYKKTFESLKTRADIFLDADPAVYELRDGIRLLAVCREASDRMLTCAIVYNLTGEEQYAERAYEEMLACAEFKDWNPYHFLDVGEMASCMGFAYDWLYNWMGDETKRQPIRTAIVEKAIYPIIEDFDDLPRSRSWNWRGELADNWCFVISGVGCASLAIADELSGQDLINANRAMEQTLIDIRRALSLFAPMGAYEEGFSYWRYSMKYFSFYMESLLSAVGEDFGYVDVPGMRLTNEYMYSVNGPARVFSYHDCGFQKNFYPPQMMFLARYFDNIDQASARMEKIKTDSLTTDEVICDMLMYGVELQSAQAEDVPLDSYLPVSEIATMRSGWESDATYVGFHCDDPMGKGGHDHMDAGQFVMDAMGENFLLDLGNENYNLEGYSQCYRLRAEGHNTIVINPDEDYGQKYCGSAKIVRHQFGEKSSFAIGDLTNAYDDDDGVVRFMRGVKLDSERTRMTVQDELTLAAPSEVWWFAHTEAEVEISDDRKSAVLTKNGKQLIAKITNGEEAYFDVMDAVPLPTSPVVPGQTTNEGIRKLYIKLTQCSDLKLTVTFTPLNSDISYDDTYIPLSKWSLNNSDFDTGILDFDKVQSTESLENYINAAGLVNITPFENANDETVTNYSVIEPVVRSAGDADFTFGNSVKITKNSQNAALRVYFSYNNDGPGRIKTNVNTEFSIKKTDVDSAEFVYEIRMADYGSELILKLGNDGKVYFLNEPVCDYEKNKWYDMQVYFDFEKAYGKLRIREEKADWQEYDGVLSDKTTAGGGERIQFGYRFGGESTTYIDNVRVYSYADGSSETPGYLEFDVCATPLVVDEEGNVITRVYSSNNESKEVMLIAASYSNGKISDVKLHKVAVNKEKGEDIIWNPQLDGEVRAFIWHDFTGCVPVDVITNQ